ncbi:hypothetical protein DN068_11930 [Taibaiella soli]|uniref:Uncharacterized protein n=1 Tax=Taibaiella soli TaxID=1649169 RepID=A0A2W2A683_9BACT|nr:hypothetical protein DN068_21885 [Taibaiella soli]PZF72567.1 hypothetical protein DN068_11930 [Taibaiella soli]
MRLKPEVTPFQFEGLLSGPCSKSYSSLKVNLLIKSPELLEIISIMYKVGPLKNNNNQLARIAQSNYVKTTPISTVN